MSTEKIIDILKKSEALLEGHFLLSSGKHSNRYVQCAKVLKNPAYAAEVLKPVVESVRELPIDLIVGPAMGGIIVAYEMGRQLGLEAVFTERKDGEMQLRRGFEIQRGAKILITEDVVTTGKSTLEVKRLLEELGGEVIGVASIVDRRAGDIELGIPLYSAIKLEIESYDPDSCPICEKGLKIEKPGSREEKACS